MVLLRGGTWAKVNAAGRDESTDWRGRTVEDVEYLGHHHDLRAGLATGGSGVDWWKAH